MNKPNKSDKPDKFNSSFKKSLQNSSIYANVSQECIGTTVDKLKLSLIDNQKIMITQSAWHAPLGIFISLLLTLLTADFKTILGISKYCWQAIFIILAVISFVWLLKTGYKAFIYRSKDPIKEIIENLKGQSS